MKRILTKIRTAWLGENTPHPSLLIYLDFNGGYYDTKPIKFTIGMTMLEVIEEVFSLIKALWRI